MTDEQIEELADKLESEEITKKDLLSALAQSAGLGSTGGGEGVTAKSVEPKSEYPEMVVWSSTDSRGRVNLGSEYADQQVKIAVLEVENE